MSNDLSDYRKSYEKQALLEVNCSKKPIDFFKEWFTIADASSLVEEANAMTISAIGEDGYPKSRVVLLKNYTDKGFVFYTNYQSEKGKAILDNNKVCLSFFWPGLEQQIIIKGVASKTTEETSDAYFVSRPDGSKLGAWASNQSKVVVSREVLEKDLEEAELRFRDKEIPRPEHWGGFIIKPISMEFWQGRPNRMHDRILYRLQKDFSWKLERLAP